MNRKLGWILVFSLGLAAAAHGQPATASTAVHGRFISFDVPGAIDTEPTSLSPDGKIVGVYTGSDGHQHGFLLNNGKYQTIDYPGSTETAAR